MSIALTATEVVALIDIDERKLRKEVEHGIFSRPAFTITDVIYLRAMALLGLTLAVEDRFKLHAAIASALASSSPPSSVSFSSVVELKIGPVATFVHDRVARFEAWKERRVVTDPSILAGEPVFPKSRLAVRQVGGMLLRGANVSDVREDYPYLTAEDLEFAPVYTTAYPKMGRPREQQTPAR